jgi:hypothetical protein
MKKNLQLLLAVPLLLSSTIQAQTYTGPSSSQTPYVVPVATGVKITSILTTGDSVGGYKMVGIPDGLGAYDNYDGTFTLLMNQELGNTVGVTRNHGSIGAFVSRWVINKSDFKVLGGADLMQRVNLWDVATSSYKTYSSYNPSSLAAFGRFCSADLAPVSAYFNSKSGKGTMARIFMNGEETGSEGRAMAHIASGPNMGTSFEVPRLGKASWENYVARGRESDTTVVIGMDDATPGQVYVYIGTKTSSGTDIEKAGLANGKLYGIAVSGYLTETSASAFPIGTVFSLANLGDVSSLSGATINTNSNTLGITNFLRPEDGAWDPTNDSNFYFNTTNAFGSPSRLWKLTFFNPDNLLSGGKITAVLDGTEGQQMFDNIAIDNWGHSINLEDVGNNAHLGKVWQYDFAKDSSKVIAVHDSTRFLLGGSKYLTQDEESSGIIDAQEILGPGMFLFVSQSHNTTTPELVEGGQLMALYNPDSYNANPEISVSGNGVNISKDDLFPSLVDNTDFGAVDTGMKVTKIYTIKNAGPGKLNISNINVSGAHASEFTLTGTPSFPTAINAGDSLKLNVQFAPKVVGLRTATITINNNDFDEKTYSYALQGVALNNRTSIANVNDASSFVTLYPNPTTDKASMQLTLKNAEHFEVAVLDINGKIVIENTTQNCKAGENLIHINTSTLSSGNYFVQLSSVNQIISMKMSVIR